MKKNHFTFFTLFLALSWVDYGENSKKCEYTQKEDQLCIIKKYPYIIRPPCIQEVCTDNEPKKTTPEPPKSEENSNKTTEEKFSWNHSYTAGIVLGIIMVAAATCAGMYYCKMNRVCLNMRRPYGELNATIHYVSDESRIHCTTDAANEEINQIP